MSDDLKDLLISAVPPLPGPPDRLGAVAARVRRARRRRYAGVFAAVVLVLAASVTAAYAVDAHRRVAPAVPPAPPAICPYDDRTGSGAVTVPPGGPAVVTTVPRGATSVTLCVVAGPLLAPVRPRTVTGGLAALVAVMNARPAVSCPSDNRWPAFQYLYAFVMTYPDGRERLFVPPDHCRYSPGSVDAFLARYRAELAARIDPDLLATPTCPANWPGAPGEHPADALAAPGGDRDVAPGSVLLPSPLVALTVCEYAENARLGWVALSRRSGLGPLRDLLNASAPHLGDDAEFCYLDNGLAPYSGWVVLAVDVTGAVVELKVLVDPCGAEILDALGVRFTHPPDAFTAWIGNLPE